jgi:hypothetical protein
MKPKMIGSISHTANILVINKQTLKWVQVGSCVYTPRHINEALQRLHLTGAWIRWIGGKELWAVGDQIAHQC